MTQIAQPLSRGRLLRWQVTVLERQDVLAVVQVAEGVSEALAEVDVSVPPGEVTRGAASEIAPVVAAEEAVVTE